MSISWFLRRKAQFSSQGTVCNTTLLIFKNKYFLFLPYPGTRYLCKQLVRFSSTDSRGFGCRFLVPLYPVFRSILYIERPILCCYQGSLPLSAFLNASWVTAVPDVWLNWTNVIVQIFETVKMWISRFLRRNRSYNPWKSFTPPYYLFWNFHMRFLSYPRNTHLCKHPVGVSPIDPRGVENWLLVSLPMIFIVTSHIGHSILYCC
jgi:hypothetical protein